MNWQIFSFTMNCRYSLRSGWTGICRYTSFRSIKNIKMSPFQIKARTDTTITILNLEAATKVLSGNRHKTGLHTPKAFSTRKACCGRKLSYFEWPQLHLSPTSCPLLYRVPELSGTPCCWRTPPISNWMGGVVPSKLVP